MDIVAVDDPYRQPLGKPYLTLATDVARRCVVGFVISFLPPGAGTVSLCLTLMLHLDSAAEFKSKGAAPRLRTLRHRARLLGALITVATLSG